MIYAHIFMVFEKKVTYEYKLPIRMPHNIHVITLVKHFKPHLIMFIFTMSKDRFARISFENAIMMSQIIFTNRLLII